MASVGAGSGRATVNAATTVADDIAAHETEFEVDFNDALLLRFHRDCFKTWQTFDGERG
jgi:hypothetical protein